MIKKLLSILAFAVPLLAAAQSATGSWTRVFSYGGTPSRVIDTPSVVYTVARGCLSAYDKPTGEQTSYTTANALSDNTISSVYYNYAERYLLIAYADYNIDLLYDDGRVCNMPEVKDAMINAGRAVRDVTFGDGRAYLATDFGMVVIDDKSKSVVESGIYDVAFTAIAVCGDNLVVGTSDGRILRSPLSERHSQLSSFEQIGTGSMTSAEGLSADKMYAVIDGKLVVASGVSASEITVEELGMNSVTEYKITPNGGGYFVHNATGMVLLDSDGARRSNVVSLPTEIRNQALGCYGGFSSVWAASGAGIGEYSYDADSKSVTVLRDRFLPDGISAYNIFSMRVSDSGDIWVGGNDNNVLSVTQISDGDYIDKTPSPAISELYNIYPDLDDSGLLVCSRFALYRIYPDGKRTAYTANNSSFASTYGSAYMIKDVRLDPEGNLWAMQYQTNAGKKPSDLHMVPADKWRAGPVKADWSAISLNGSGITHQSRMAIAAQSGCVIATGNHMVNVYDTKKTWADLSDDDFRSIPCGNLIDEDGVSVSAGHQRYAVEDHDGRVWVGGYFGIYYFRDPREVFNSSFTIVRPKVPRNDGTGLADILLSGVDVYWIAVDPTNRKWIATNGSGLYLVNEDGTEILQHFTTENSDIPSNVVLTVECDPKTNEVYVGTDSGLAIYASDGSAARPDYSDVYAYPNPVTPDYTGWITVTGLMENSLVKIADAAGNVFFNGRSEGGMITWDGCDTSGRRVRTGVYFVMASQNADGNSGVVTKILVVN